MRNKIISGLMVSFLVLSLFSGSVGALSDLSSVGKVGGSYSDTSIQASTVDSDGAGYIASSSEIARVNSVSDWTVSTNVGTPSDITVDPNGQYFYVLDADNGIQKRYKENGTLAATYSSESEFGEIETYETSSGKTRVVVGTRNTNNPILRSLNADTMNSEWAVGIDWEVDNMETTQDGDIYLSTGNNFERYDGRAGGSLKGDYFHSFSSGPQIAVNESSNQLFAVEVDTVYAYDGYNLAGGQTQSYTSNDVSNLQSVETVDNQVVIGGGDQIMELRSQDDLSNELDQKSLSFALYQTDQEGRFMSYGDGLNSDSAGVIKLKDPSVTSVDVSISGNSTEYNTYGADNFEVNATATFSDGSTQEVSEDGGTTYTYDSNILTQLSPKDTFEGNSAGSDTVTVEYTDSNGNTVSDSITINTQDKTQSVDVSISGNSNSFTSTGAQDFTVTTTRTLYDGSTQTVSTDTNTQYYYNSTQLNQLSPLNTFEGKNAGTDTIRGEYTDTFSNTNYDDTISVTVEDPLEPQSLELTGLPSEMDEGQTDSVTATVTYGDGSTEDVTLNSDTTYQSSNTTRLTVDANGGVNALYWGDATVSSDYYDSWFDKTISDSQTTTILGDPSNLQFNIANNEPRRNNSVSMSATLIYEDGRTEDVSDDINSVTTTSNKPARTVFDFQNNTVRFTESETVTEYSITMANTYEGVALSDSDNASVKPSRDFHDWQKLNGPAKTFVIFTDWALITIVTTLLLSVIVGVQTGSSGLAMGTFTVTTAIAWTFGLVSIFIPATLLLFQAFSYVALNIELTR